MYVFPGMLVAAAEKAGMKVPDNPDNLSSWEDEVYPHFFVFCQVQLGCAVHWGEHWNNAKVISEIPDNEIMLITIEELVEIEKSFGQLAYDVAPLKHEEVPVPKTSALKEFEKQLDESALEKVLNELEFIGFLQVENGSRGTWKEFQVESLKTREIKSEHAEKIKELRDKIDRLKKLKTRLVGKARDISQTDNADIIDEIAKIVDEVPSKVRAALANSEDSKAFIGQFPRPVLGKVVGVHYAPKIGGDTIPFVLYDVEVWAQTPGFTGALSFCNIPHLGQQSGGVIEQCVPLCVGQIVNLEFEEGDYNRPVILGKWLDSKSNLLTSPSDADDHPKAVWFYCFMFACPCA